jgi:general L-amino acid transport system permease protein
VIFASVFINRKILTRARTIQEETGIRPTTWWQSILVLVGPLAVTLFALGFHLGIPELKGFNFAGGVNVTNAFVVLWLALSLYTGAFIAEIVRAGVLAISKGQSEAAFALGLRPRRTMSLVILPQALRVIIPPLISQFLNLTKNSSLAIAVGYMDLRGTLGGITLNQTGRELEAILLMMLIYLAVSLIISGAMNVYNSRVKLQER